MMVERCDYYSDDEYRQALQCEEEQTRKAWEEYQRAVEYQLELTEEQGDER